jgi:hypothetical protein
MIEEEYDWAVLRKIMLQLINEGYQLEQQIRR